MGNLCAGTKFDEYSQNIMTLCSSRRYDYSEALSQTHVECFDRPEIRQFYDRPPVGAATECNDVSGIKGKCSNEEYCKNKINIDHMFCLKCGKNMGRCLVCGEPHFNRN